MNASLHRLLMREIEAWRADGLIGDDLAGRLTARYPVPASRNWPLLITGILGASLIGLGVILLLAHNWDALGRPARVILAYLPLLAAVGFTGWRLARDEEESAAPWREGAGVFLGLAIGAALSLVAQTYQMGGTFRDLLLLWMLLLLPVAYVLDAVMPALMYLAGIAGWAIGQDHYDARPYGFWPLLAALVPLAVLAYRRDPGGVRKSWLFAGLAVALLIGTPACMRHSHEVVWFTLYAMLFALLLLAGGIWEKETGGRPLTLLGWAGLGVMVFLYSFVDFWQDMGRDVWWRQTLQPWEQAVNTAHLGAVATAYVILLVVAFRRPRDWPFRLAAVFPLAAALLMAVNLALGGRHLLPAVLMNVFAFALGLLAAAEGVRAGRLFVMNAGLVLVAGLLIARFFDSDMSILWRGVAFILLGAGFLAANVLMIRRRRAS